MILMIIMSGFKMISISYVNYEELSKLKRYNSKRRGCIDTYDDVIKRLIKVHEKKINPGGD